MSNMEGLGTRERIVAIADRLFYEAGYGRASFAVIAADVGISKGNFHHHFKVKDDILAEVIVRRRETTAAMLSGWESEASTPEGQLWCFIEMVRQNRVDIMRYGCPVGSLCSELAKDGHALLASAKAIVDQFCDWLTLRFERLGFGAESRAHAVHLFVLSQGVALLANVSKDTGVLDREVDEMHRWLDGLLAAAAPHPT